MDTDWSESHILDLCRSIRRHDLELTGEQQRASDFYAVTHARRFALVLQHFAPLLAPGAQIFSVGSMPNQLELLFARFLRANLTGSTYSPPDTRDKFRAVYEMRDGWRYEMDVYLRDLTRDPLPAAPQSCDAVLCFEVVEHFLNSPLPLFREIQRALKPDGHLLLSTPNMQHWHRLVYLLNGQTYPDVDFDEPIESRHTHIFSFRELETLLQAAGLEVVTHFFEDPWDNARHRAPFDQRAPVTNAARELVKGREEFLHECIFLAARPAQGVPLLTKGWHAVERSGSNWWCWTPGRGEIRFLARKDTPAILRGELYSIQRPNSVTVTVNGKPVTTLNVTWDQFGPLPPVTLLLRAGDNVIELVSSNGPVTLKTDGRPLAIAVKNLSISAHGD